jgi:hypothetical protein
VAEVELVQVITQVMVAEVLVVIEQQQILQ